MRIQFVGPVPPIRGGISQHSTQLVRTLQRLGHEVDVRSWHRQYPRLLYRGEQVDAGTPNFAGARFTLRWWQPVSWLAAGRAAREADLLVLPWVHPVQAAPLRTILATSGSVERVAVVHNSLPHERVRFDASLTRFFLRGLTRAVVHTDAERERLHALVPSLPVRVVPLPPLLDVASTSLPPAATLRLLMLGFVRPYKGVDLVFDAVEHLRHARSVHLTVAGECWNPTVTELREDLGRRGIGDLVTIRPGYVPDDEMSALLAAHHIVVAPYRRASQSGVVPLAHSAGRPVVVTPVDGLREQVVDGVNGVAAAAVDGGAIAAAIEYAAEHLQELAEGARLNSLHWESFARAVAT